MPRFQDNEIISLIGAPPRHELAESVGPDLRLADLFRSAGINALDDLPLAYGTAQGEPRLRAAIAERHGVTAEEVVTTVGGMHALFLLAFVLCGPGDEAVIGTPAFPLARNGLVASGATVRDLPLRFDDGYQMDFAALEKMLNARTRIVSLASPQNPAGVVLSMVELRKVLEAMQRRCPNAWLVVDETYREAVYGSAATGQSAVSLDPRVIVISSLSKCHGAPGLRLGWAISRNEDARKQLVLAKFNTVISCSALDEALGLKVLEQHKAIIDARRGRLQAGYLVTQRWVQENASLIEWVPPNAGALCCVRLRKDAFDEPGVDRFYQALSKEGVRVADGRWFGEEARVFRLGFGHPPLPQLEAALSATTRALQSAAVRAPSPAASEPVVLRAQP